MDTFSSHHGTQTGKLSFKKHVVLLQRYPFYTGCHATIFFEEDTQTLPLNVTKGRMC